MAASARDFALAFGAVAEPDGGAADESFAACLGKGCRGDMGWMAATRRRSPAALRPTAGSIVAVGMNYCPEEGPLAAREAAVSVYARGRRVRHAGGKQAPLAKSFMDPL